MKRNLYTLAAAFVVLFTQQALCGTYGGGLGFAYEWSTNPGDGSDGNPYQISTPEQLMSIGSDEVLLTKHYILMNDIVFDPENNPEHVFDKALIAPNIGMRWKFSGKFNGDYHRIVNIKIVTPSRDYVGLFGFISSNATVTRVGLENVFIQAREFVGGIAGFSTQSLISDCYVKGDIRGTYKVGGIIGDANYSTINSSYVSGFVSGGRYTGGIVGYMALAVNDCYTSGQVEGSRFVGGIVGRSTYEINRCYTTCKIVSPMNTGGIYGSSASSTLLTSQGCFWDIEISQVGADFGKVGRGLTTAEMTTMNTYSLNNWAGSPWTIKEGHYPRLAWENIEGSYIGDPIIDLEGEGTDLDPFQIMTKEEFLLINQNIYFWDKCLTLLNDIDLKNRSLDCIGNLHMAPFTGIFDGSGHTISNFNIDLTGAMCVGLFGHVNFGEIRNLNVKNTTIKPAYLTGGLIGYNLEGIVENCSISGEIFGDQSQAATVGGLRVSTGGLIGYNKESQLVNCNANCTISARTNTGGLVGCNYNSTILNCFANSQIDSFLETGGFVGRNWYGTIKYSYANSVVNSGKDVGGFAGLTADGEIECCYATGSIHGTSVNIGGFAGRNHDSMIKDCYSTANLISDRLSWVGGFIGDNSELVERCFWDTDTSGQTTSEGGTGKTTLEMKSLHTFISAGWDFVGKDVNGTDNIWWMPVGDYPKLVGVGAGPVVVAGLELVSKERVGRTEFEYTYRLEVENNHSEDLTGVTITLQPASDNMVVIDGDILISQINSGEVLVTDDTITLRVDRAGGPADGKWIIEYGLSPAPIMQGVTFGLYADIVEDGVVNEKDLVRMMQSWLTSDAVADIAPAAEPDGIVNLLDFQILSSEWE